MGAFPSFLIVGTKAPNCMVRFGGKWGDLMVRFGGKWGNFGAEDFFQIPMLLEEGFGWIDALESFDDSLLFLVNF